MSSLRSSLLSAYLCMRTTKFVIDGFSVRILFKYSHDIYLCVNFICLFKLKFLRVQWRSQPKMFGPASSAEGASFLEGYGGILPRKILKTRTLEMPFPAIWAHIWYKACLLLRSTSNCQSLRMQTRVNILTMCRHKHNNYSAELTRLRNTSAYIQSYYIFVCIWMLKLSCLYRDLPTNTFMKLNLCLVKSH